MLKLKNECVRVTPSNAWYIVISTMTSTDGCRAGGCVAGWFHLTEFFRHVSSQTNNEPAVNDLEVLVVDGHYYEGPAYIRENGEVVSVRHPEHDAEQDSEFDESKVRPRISGPPPQDRESLWKTIGDEGKRLADALESRRARYEAAEREFVEREFKTQVAMEAQGMFKKKLPRCHTLALRRTFEHHRGHAACRTAALMAAQITPSSLKERVANELRREHGDARIGLLLELPAEAARLLEHGNCREVERWPADAVNAIARRLYVSRLESINLITAGRVANPQDLIARFLERETRQQELSAALASASLSPNERQIIEHLLRIPDMLDYGGNRELAGLLGRPAGQVGKEKCLAFKKLRAALNTA